MGNYFIEVFSQVNYIIIYFLIMNYILLVFLVELDCQYILRYMKFVKNIYFMIMNFMFLEFLDRGVCIVDYW